MKFTTLIPMCLALFTYGCLAGEAGDADEAETSQEISTTNGLLAINGLNTTNGLNTQNGLNTNNGLNTQNGLKDAVGLMSTAAGRNTITYMAKCALAAGHSITKKDQAGVSYTFLGALGVAPAWETGACNEGCQQWLSACLVAHLNTAGVHIPLWLVGGQPQLGWELNATYPNQEGSFFGNVFVSPPKMYYCNGRNFNVNVVPGRIGSGTAAPYTLPYNPWSTDSSCPTFCTPSDTPYTTSGYKACNGYNEVVTTWRQ